MPPKVKTVKMKIAELVNSNDRKDNQEEIINYLRDPSNDINSFESHDQSILYWAARDGLEDILKEVLKRSEAKELLNEISDDNTALSRSAYDGNQKIVDLLLIANAEIEVIDENGTIANAYEQLGQGYLCYPEKIKSYTQVFMSLILKDSNKPKREFFVGKYQSTSDRSYLVCIMFYDRIYSKMKCSSGDYYKNRNILEVEDFSIRKFFRCNTDIRVAGVSHVLKDQLFSGTSVVIDGTPSRSIIITLIDKMARTKKDVVEEAVKNQSILFNVTFKLGSTEVIYKWKPAKFQRGNCLVSIEGMQLESYGNSLTEGLEILTETTENIKVNERSRKLGQLFLEKSKKLNSFHFQEFTYHNNKIILRINGDSKKNRSIAKPEQAKVVIDRLNALLILWSIAEPTRRLSGHLNKNNNNSISLDHLPVATMQMRALQLLAQGLTGVIDLFGHSKEYKDNPDLKAKYGVVTGKALVENYEIAKNKSIALSNIDIPTSSLVEESSWLSRNYTKQILHDEYGSGNESSDDDYSDEELPSPRI